MDKTLICSYARTPIGSFQGQLKTIHASKLGANTICATIERSIINKKDIDLPRCDTVGVSGIATGMAGLLAAQKTINFLINLNQESNILSLLNVLKQDLQNINLKNNSKCYLNKS